jgi:hypothetical protein
MSEQVKINIAGGEEGDEKKRNEKHVAARNNVVEPCIRIP